MNSKTNEEAKTIYYTQRRTGLIEKKDPGFVHIYYGRGAGKTTSAVGSAIRAAGGNLQVDFVQFMKSGNSGEVAVLKGISKIRYQCPGEHPFIMSNGPEPIHYEHAEKAYQYALEAVQKGTDLLICDEILDALIFELISKDRILNLMDQCRQRIELIMTGMDVPRSIMAKVDYATEFNQAKHPYYRGARARKGFEY